MNRSLLPLALLFLSLAGCDLLAPPEEPDHVLMPLAVGNKWIGERTTYRNGAPVTTPDTLEVVAVEAIDGENWYRTNRGDLFINRANGLEMKTDMCDAIVSLYPTTAGESVRVGSSMLVLLPDQSEPVSVDIINRTVSVDSTVTVPAGTYSAHHYRLELTNPNATFIESRSYFYVPDIGPVRIDTESRGTLIERWELEDARLM
jgi:hypothetical protein